MDKRNIVVPQTDDGVSIIFGNSSMTSNMYMVALMTPTFALIA